MLQKSSLSGVRFYDAMLCKLEPHGRSGFNSLSNLKRLGTCHAPVILVTQGAEAG